MRAITLSLSCVALGLSSLAAIKPDRFTATWDVPAAPAVYEFRWQHFAHPDWITLPAQPAVTGTFTAAFHPLPPEPTTDRWMCLDARSLANDQVGPWLSETPDGPACEGVEVGVIPVQPPPVPPDPPALDVFTNIRQTDGRIAIDYHVAECPRGVQQTTRPAKDGRKTITLSCRR